MAVALIIEDHPLFRNALVHLTRTVLGTEPKLAGNIEAGMQVLSEDKSVTLIIMDLGLPGALTGSLAVSKIHAAHPRIPLLVVSGSEDASDISAALAAGANAYVSKKSEIAQIADRIRQMAESTNNSKVTQLTERQHETLRLLCGGLSNKEIGRQLDLSDATVKMHITSIFRALDVVTRTQAVLVGRSLGLDLLPLRESDRVQ